MEWHSPYDNGSSARTNNEKNEKSKTGAGWCMVGDTNQKYLIEDMEGGVGVDMRDPGTSSEVSDEMVVLMLYVSCDIGGMLGVVSRLSCLLGSLLALRLCCIDGWRVIGLEIRLRTRRRRA